MDSRYVATDMVDIRIGQLEISNGGNGLIVKINGNEVPCVMGVELSGRFDELWRCKLEMQVPVLF